MMNETKINSQSKGPLVGYRVLELGTTIAGPFCARLLADFGAEVIKVEHPSGDPVRFMGQMENEESLYGASIFRNKRLISVDLKTKKGFQIVLDLMKKSDIVIENFRPGTLERLGLGYEEVSKHNPGIIMVRISGYGQSGPYSARTGYGVTAEAVGGVRYLTGDPDLPPARVGLAMTDHLAALYGAFGAMMALLNREETGMGQVIDTALYEAAFSMMEPHVPAFERLGVIPKRSGPRLANTAPNSLYPTKDNDYILIAANNDSTFQRLTEAMGQPELAENPKYSSQQARKERVDEIDQIVGKWTKNFNASEIERLLLDKSVPCSRIFTIKDIFDDAHFKERDQLLKEQHPKFGDLTVIGIAPKLSKTPGSVYQLGGELGRDNYKVLTEILKMDREEIDNLLDDGIIKAEKKLIEKDEKYGIN